MINYVELTKRLKEKDEYIVSKLSIYHELSSLTNVEELAAEDVNEIVEYLHNIYMNNDEMSYAYPKVAEAAAEVCNFDLKGLLHSIRKNSAKMEEQILTQIIWRYLKIMIKDIYMNRILDLKSRIEKERSFNKGLVAGAKTQKIETLLIMYDKGYDIKEISNIVSLSEIEVKQTINEYELRKKSGINIVSLIF